VGLTKIYLSRIQRTTAWNNFERLIINVDLSEETIQNRLQSRQGHSNSIYRTAEGYNLKKDARPASVLIPLVCVEGSWHVLLIRRSETLPEHRGQVAFPGGARDPEDADAVQTALRETFEEIGVKSDQIRILGRLDELITNSGYILTPVVGIMSWPQLLKLESKEVARAFLIPLSWLADPAHHEERDYQRDDQIRRVIFFDLYDGELLWGISARIMVEFLTALEM
jgi:8-oxo-dGTP pyrophosphatase MutT (NUDIX family)